MQLLSTAETGKLKLYATPAAYYLGKEEDRLAMQRPPIGFNLVATYRAARSLLPSSP